MTLEQIYYIGQTVAVFAILISLTAIWLQMRQTGRLARIETTRGIWSDATEMLRSQVEDDEKAAFLQRALFDGEKISEAEKTRLSLIMASMFVTFENGFAMSKSGMLDDIFWPRLRVSMAEYLRAPRGQRWWARARKGIFAPNTAFVAEVDSVIVEINAENQDAE